MRGHVRKRGNRWAFVVDVGTDDTGRRRQKWRSGLATRKEAEAELRQFLYRVEHGGDPFPTDIRLRDFVVRWVEHQATRVRPSTVRRYRKVFDLHVLPVVGNLKLTALRPAHVQAVIDATARKGLSNRTVTEARNVLSSALRHAVAWGLIQVNPATAVRPPKVERRRLDVPSAAEVARLLEAARGSTWEVPLLLAATTARRSEVLALAWNEVDLDRGRIRIVRSLHRVPNEDGPGRRLDFYEPKTSRSRGARGARLRRRSIA
ncbi:MAG TPA: Arm DNA-binding domain-containing protein [Acidimicrobiales bacterium]|jgi:integrase